jgi:DNA-binding beta-propeller fold protein YncE
MRWRFACWSVVLTSAATVACGGNSSGPQPGPPAAFVLVSGEQQSAQPAMTLPQPLVVQVNDATGIGVPGVHIRFFTGGDAGFASGAGFVPGLDATTDAQGRTSANYRLGSGVGVYGAFAQTEDVLNHARVYFRATATGPQPALVATVQVGEAPQGVSVDPVSNRIFVGNNGNQVGCDFLPPKHVDASTVTVIDGSTHQTQSVTVGRSPIYAVPYSARGQLYVATSGDVALDVLDAASFQRLVLHPNAASHQPAIYAARDEVWANNSNGQSVSVVRGVDAVLVANVATPARTHGVAVNPVSDEVLLTNVDPPIGVTVIDASTRSVKETVALSAALGIAVNTTTNRIFVSTSLNNRIFVLDGTTKAMVKEIDVGRHSIELSVDETRNRIYFASQTIPYSVGVIDGVTNTLLGYYPVGACPWGVAVNPDTNRVYVGNQADNTVTVLDASKLP